MKILFLANSHAGLYKEIVAEMERKGHRVEVIRDKTLRYDPYFGFSRLKSIRRFFFVGIYNIYNHYWDKMIATDARLSEPYDLFLALSGVSVGERLICHLESINPQIKKVLYTWDNCAYYAYDRLLPWFDRTYTFDIEDAKSNPKWRLLPIYCKVPMPEKTIVCEYDIFSIGSNHGDRLPFLYKVLSQIQKIGLSYYIKVIELQKQISWKERVKYVVCKIIGKKRHAIFLGRIDFILEEKDAYQIKRDTFIPQFEYNELISKSVCILDDQRSSQSGLTARFMWALANRKKIITTNKWAYSYSFVNPNQVLIIDKSNPVLSEPFIKSTLSENDYSNVTSFYIENWVDELLSAAK